MIAANANPLAKVRHWLYQIDVNLTPAQVNRIVASKHDMVVIDFIPSEVNNTDYPIRNVVRRLHDAAHPKLVLAYIDIGQAEDYRVYWQPGWKIGNPEWLVALDPDGWEGNYPVAYWWDEWQELWIGNNGLLEQVIDAGFDGIYLDWVEAYSDEDVHAAARQDGVNARTEMVWWVNDIARFTRARKPGFLIIGQNAAELASSSAKYRKIVDAVAQEQTWFDGAANNRPPGDCPLPRTEAAIETAAYRRSLSKPCRRLHDQFPDSTLHVSSQWYLRHLKKLKRQGEIVFTVDYAQKPKNIAWTLRASRKHGFKPFVGTRFLNRYIPPR